MGRPSEVRKYENPPPKNHIPEEYNMNKLLTILKFFTCYLIGDIGFGLTFWKRTIYEEIKQTKIS